MFGLAGVSFLATLVLGWQLPREILPQLGEWLVVGSLRLPAWTTLEETARQVGRL